jgi:hypothetical protein
MSQLLGLFGLNSGSLGVAGGTNSSSTNQTGSGSSSTSTQYSPGQTALQDLLSGTFSSLIPSVASGGMSPNVQTTETAGADQINKSYSTMGDRLNRFLAARGFGKSGQVGQAELQTETGRQSALAGNYASAAQMQLNQNNTLLSDALAAAYASMGSNVNWSNVGSSNTSGSGFGMELKAGGGVTPGGGGN